MVFAKPKLLELACLSIVLIYVLTRHVRLRSWGERWRFLVRFVAIACAGFIGEDSMIAAYGAYAYSTSAWSTFLDHRVPLVVVLVWPVVIDSAMLLAREIVTPAPLKLDQQRDVRLRWASIADQEKVTRSALRLPLVTSLIVLTDASLIEPIAVRAKLWSWTEPNVFDVPLIGILGWAFFAFFATLILERGWRASVVLFGVLAAPLLTHGAILVSWWAIFRWVLRQQPIISGTTLMIGAFVVMIPLSIVLGRLATTKISPFTLLERAPGALFFFGLLATIHPEARDLMIYAAAFALPYVSMLTIGLVKERQGGQVIEMTSNH